VSLTELTVLKDPFDIQSISGTRLIVSTAFQVTRQLPCSGVVDQSWVALADSVLRADKDDRYVGNVCVVLGHLGEVRVDGVEAHLVLETEDEDNGVDPVCELYQRNTQLTAASLL